MFGWIVVWGPVRYSSSQYDSVLSAFNMTAYCLLVCVRDSSSGVARGGFGGSNPPIEKCQKISEDKIVEKIQRWSLHVLYRHQTTSFAQTKVTYLLKLTNYFKAVVLARNNANTTPRNHTRIQMTVRVQQMDIPERGCHESRRESRMGGEAFCSEINHDHR